MKYWVIFLFFMLLLLFLMLCAGTSSGVYFFEVICYWFICYFITYFSLSLVQYSCSKISAYKDKREKLRWWLVLIYWLLILFFVLIIWETILLIVHPQWLSYRFLPYWFFIVLYLLLLLYYLFYEVFNKNKVNCRLFYLNNNALIKLSQAMGTNG